MEQPAEEEDAARKQTVPAPAGAVPALQDAALPDAASPPAPRLVPSSNQVTDSPWLQDGLKLLAAVGATAGAIAHETRQPERMLPDWMRPRPADPPPPPSPRPVAPPVIVASTTEAVASRAQSAMAVKSAQLAQRLQMRTILANAEVALEMHAASGAPHRLKTLAQRGAGGEGDTVTPTSRTVALPPTFRFGGAAVKTPKAAPRTPHKPLFMLAPQSGGGATPHRSPHVGGLRAHQKAGGAFSPSWRRGNGMSSPAPSTPVATASPLGHGSPAAKWVAAPVAKSGGVRGLLAATRTRAALAAAKAQAEAAAAAAAAAEAKQRAEDDATQAAAIATATREAAAALAAAAAMRRSAFDAAKAALSPALRTSLAWCAYLSAQHWAASGASGWEPLVAPRRQALASALVDGGYDSAHLEAIARACLPHTVMGGGGGASGYGTSVPTGAGWLVDAGGNAIGGGFIGIGGSPGGGLDPFSGGDDPAVTAASTSLSRQRALLESMVAARMTTGPGGSGAGVKAPRVPGPPMGFMTSAPRPTARPLASPSPSTAAPPAASSFRVPPPLPRLPSLSSLADRAVERARQAADGASRRRSEVTARLARPVDLSPGPGLVTLASPGQSGGSLGGRRHEMMAARALEAS